MRLDVVTIFPDYLAPLRLSLPGKAQDAGLLDVRVHDLRDWTHDVHKAVDDSPYGGGPGMVMKPQVWGDALDAVCPDDALLVVPTPAGRPFTQAVAREYAAEQDSFSDGLLEGPSYTRPEVWRELAVPDVLRSGNHAVIARWRRDQALERTYHRRPDLLEQLPEAALDRHDRAVLDRLAGQCGTR